MPLGKTWREALLDGNIPMRDLAGSAGDWDYCAVGERAELLGYRHGPYALLGEVDGLRSLGSAFSDAVSDGNRQEALRLLDLIESRTPLSMVAT